MTLPKTTTISIISFVVLVLMPATVWVHNSFADSRYVQKSELTTLKIEDMDDKLFEISQEILLEDDEQKKKKWTSRKEYYQNKKESLVRKLEQSK